MGLVLTGSRWNSINISPRLMFYLWLFPHHLTSRVVLDLRSQEVSTKSKPNAFECVCTFSPGAGRRQRTIAGSTLLYSRAKTLRRAADTAGRLSLIRIALRHPL